MPPTPFSFAEVQRDVERQFSATPVSSKELLSLQVKDQLVP